MSAKITSASIKLIADSLGLQYQVITKKSHKIVWDKSSRDPDIVYLFEPEQIGCLGVDQDGERLDAAIFYQGTTRYLIWGTRTVTSTRKLLERLAASTECVVCMEETVPNQAMDCPTCGSVICAVCMMKVCLTENACETCMSGNGQVSQMRQACQECRIRVRVDARGLCRKVIDNLQQFTETQQAALLCIKENDPNFANGHEAVLRGLLQHQQILAKRFAKGSIVTVHGLENEIFKQWNGKKAVLVGERIIKRGFIRWPVKLKEAKSTKTVLIKQCNLRKNS